MPYAQATRPESITQIVKRSLKLYRHALKRTFLVGLLLSVVSFIPRLIALFTDQAYFTNLPVMDIENLWLILVELTGLVIFTILLWRTECVMDKKRDTLKDDFLITMKKLPRIIGAAIVETALILMLFFMTLGIFYFLVTQVALRQENHFQILLVFLPIIGQCYLNIFILVLLMFYLPLILAENKHIFEALGKSAMLVWGNWWRTFMLIVIPWVCYLVVLMIVKYVFRVNIHIYFVKITQLSYFATIVQILLFALFLPWLAAIVLVMMKDLELRNTRLKKSK